VAFSNNECCLKSGRNDEDKDVMVMMLESLIWCVAASKVDRRTDLAVAPKIQAAIENLYKDFKIDDCHANPDI
jgi:hypothetical protein